MNVFISWSGVLSHRVGLVLKEWLPTILESSEPFLSSEDIDKGSRWFTDIGNKLDESDFGILCITRENLNSPWVLFEAGALSKKVGQSRVCPFLVDLLPSDLKGPLANFNAAMISKNDVLKLFRSVNSACSAGPVLEKTLEKRFALAWDQMNRDFTDAISSCPAPSSGEDRHRSPEDILEELLRLSRSMAQSVQPTGSGSQGASLYDRRLFEAAVKEAMENQKRKLPSLSHIS